MDELKLGKLPATRPYGLGDLDQYMTVKPPQPPAESPVPLIGEWGMLGNSTYGDCVVAGTEHIIMASNAEVAEKDPEANAAEVVKQYLALSPDDEGLNVSTTLQLWRSHGLFAPANKIAAYAPVRLNDILALHRCVAFYGSCNLGVNLPQSAMDQFNAGKPWTVTGDNTILGGHDIVVVGYDSEWLRIVTWGKVIRASFAWFATYADEAWAIITNEVVEAGHGPGKLLDLVGLKADLDHLAG